jgi:hypothetical protein
MPRTSRRLALTALLLGLALTLAAAPAQARESAPAGWFGTLTQQLMQWTAGWWSWPAPGSAPFQGQGRPARAARQPIRPDCGVLVDPNGQCLAPAPRSH